MPISKPAKPSFEPQVLFKNWVKLFKPGDNITSTFEDFRLTEVEDEWVDIDNADATRAQHAHLSKYAAGEYLAHTLAYRKDLSENAIVDVIEETGLTAEYRCQLLQTTHAGLVGYILVPIQTKADQIPDIKVIFRGTKPDSWASVSRDLESCGAGSVSFAENRDLILKQINEAVKKQNQQVSITVAGHSLGGADAQNCTAALIDAVSQNAGIQFVARGSQAQTIPSDCRDELVKVGRIQLCAYNAAGIPKITAEKAQIELELLAEKRAKGKVIPTFESFTQLVGGDGVQQTGEAHLFSDASKEQAKVDVLKAHIGSEHHHKIGLPAAAAMSAAAFAGGGAVGLAAAATLIAASAGRGLHDTAHSHTQHLHREPRPVQYDSYSNETPQSQGQVKTELSKKSGSLNALHKAGCAVFSGVTAAAKAITFGYATQKTQADLPSSVSKLTVPAIPRRPWYSIYT